MVKTPKAKLREVLKRSADGEGSVLYDSGDHKLWTPPIGHVMAGLNWSSWMLGVCVETDLSGYAEEWVAVTLGLGPLVLTYRRVWPANYVTSLRAERDALREELNEALAMVAAYRSYIE